jgi:hypothetical protein
MRDKLEQLWTWAAAQLILSIIFAIAACYMAINGMDVPEWMVGILCMIIGYLFKVTTSA